MPKRSKNFKKQGRRGDSPIPENSTSKDYSQGLHKIELQSRRLLRKVTDKQKAKWKPLSKSTVELVIGLIEKHKQSACEDMTSQDRKVMDDHMTQLKNGLEEAFAETAAPPNATNYDSMEPEVNRLTKLLEEHQRTLKEIYQNISKLERFIEVKEKELEELKFTDG